MILLDLILAALAGLALLAYLGYVPALLLLPPALGGLRWAALPWTGYALFVVLAQFTTQAGLNMAQTVLLALVLGTAGNVVYLLVCRGRRLPAVPLGGSRAGLGVAALAALVYVLGVLPILIYGYHTLIGENWDGEIYLALGSYLRDYPQAALAAAPPNPLLHDLLTPPYSVRTHGFSYVQAAVGALTGQESLVTLAPLLALLRALAVPAGYFFYRAAWGWTPGPALLAAAATGLNPFLLWVTYNTFGMQVPSLGLLPLAVAATLLALRAPRPATAAYAALIAAALAVTYHPALTAWIALAGAGGLVLLVAAGRAAWRVALTGLGIGLGMLMLSAVAQLLSVGGFLTQYAEQTAGLGLTTFTSPTDALGLSLSFRALLAAGPGQPLVALAAQGYTALIAGAGLACLALGLLWLTTLVRRPTPAGLVTAATVAGAVLFLLLFFRPLGYVYGWFKAQSFVAFVLTGAVAGGLDLFWTRRAAMPPWSRPAAAAAGALPAAALSVTLALLLWQYHWPQRYSPEMVQAAQVRAATHPGDSVFVSSSRLMPGRLFNGLLSYFLRDRAVYGTFETAYASWAASRPDGVYAWGVLPAHELPALYGYRPADQVWANALLTLYRAPPDLRYQQNWERRGDYPRLAVGTPLTWQVTADSLRLGAGAPPGGAPASRALELALAAFTPATVTVTITTPGDAPRSAALRLAPGLQAATLSLTAPGTLRLEPAPGAGPLAVRWATLRAAEPGPTQAPRVAPPLPGVLMLGIRSQAAGNDVETRLQRVDTRPADRQADRVVLDVYRAGGAGGAADHFGYWSFALRGPTATFRVPLAGGAAAGGVGAAPLPATTARGAATTGRFSASLAFYHGDQALETVTDIYTFDAGPSAGGVVIRNLAVRVLPLLFY